MKSRGSPWTRCIPRIIAECLAALRAVRPENKVSCRPHGKSRCTVVSAYSNSWPYLIPQHGPGRKHSRRIELAEWQRRIVASEPRAFIRGLIHSDGCRVVANDRGVASVRYHFTNRSEDIKALFCAVLDGLEVHWTRSCDRQISVYRKGCTERLDGFVGPKR